MPPLPVFHASKLRSDKPTPYKDPEKQREAARARKRRQRASPTFRATERKERAIKRGGDHRPSTEYVAGPLDGKAAHGLVDRLTYNYGHAEGGKPQQRDLMRVRVHRRRWDGDFEPDQPASTYQRTVRLAREQTKRIPGDSSDLFADDPLARDFYVYFSAQRTRINHLSAVALARTVRRLGVEVGYLVRALLSQSDLAPAKRAELVSATRLTDGQFANALLILRGQGLLREHKNTWPHEYSLNPPRA